MQLVVCWTSGSSVFKLCSSSSSLGAFFSSSKKSKVKISRSHSLKHAEKHDQRRASGPAGQTGKEPGPGLRSGPESEPAAENQNTAANNQLQRTEVEAVLPSAGDSSELQPQAAVETAAALPSGQGGAMGSDSSQLKGEESKSTVQSSESEVKQLDSSTK